MVSEEEVVLIVLTEMLDFGYPQITEPDVLKAFITTKGLKTQLKTKELSEVLKTVTGTVSWRQPGIKHRKNEVFLDVIESVNMLMSSKGTILHADVTGKIQMKCFLTGMPECKFGLNDKLMLQNDSSASSKKSKAIDIDDVTFHQCVKLGNFDNERSISFIPPDGEFELMRYRVQNAIVPPFRLVSPTVRELGKTRLEVQVTVKSVFNQRLFGKNVQVTIPTPKNTAKCDIRVSVGKASYDPGKSAIIWKVKKFPGNAEYSLNAEVNLIAQTVEKKSESKPPIQLSFQVPMFTASGLHVRYLKIYEKSGYQAVKWVRYVTQGGTYENRY
jgi:AP-2 complex subunit mu-1